jgi:hypothetical protein
VRTPPQPEKEFTDSVNAIPGDDLLISYGLYLNPAASILQANVIDSTSDGLSVSGESLTLNHVPIISAGEFNGVFSTSITPLIRKGSNEMQLQASIPVESQNKRLVHVFYYERVNGFGETTVERSNPVIISVINKNLSLLDDALKQEKDLAGTDAVRKATTLK